MIFVRSCYSPHVQSKSKSFLMELKNSKTPNYYACKSFSISNIIPFTWATPRCVQEHGTILAFQYCIQGHCMSFWVSEIKPCVHPDLGEWGDWEECPPGEHVKGMQLRIQAKIDFNLI